MASSLAACPEFSNSCSMFKPLILRISFFELVSLAPPRNQRMGKKAPLWMPLEQEIVGFLAKFFD